MSRPPWQASQTDRHQRSIAWSRSAPAGAAITSRGVIVQRGVRALHLGAGEAAFQVQIQAGEGEDDADRLARRGRRLHEVCVDDVLQDEVGPAHRVDVELIVAVRCRGHGERAVGSHGEVRSR